MLLAVLPPFAQLTVYEVPFPADIGHHRGVPVASLVGAGDPLFLGLRVVAGGHVHVYGDKSARELRRRGMVLHEQLRVLP